MTRQDSVVRWVLIFLALTAPWRKLGGTLAVIMSMLRFQGVCALRMTHDFELEIQALPEIDWA